MIEAEAPARTYTAIGLSYDRSKIHEIWVEQYEAAQGIKQRFGLKAAFDYLVVEKLLNYAEAASEHREFARELPKFLSLVRLMFTPLEVSHHIARVERDLYEKSVAIAESDDLFHECDSAVAKRTAQFAAIKELLTAPDLGTS